ncbi:hypothetical protein HU200_025799 [Digitaria exilis]|uniref:Secreted protein n=1 Tax=Digitaria exilis TaxID=1010633 RepID=A0A835ESD3_9POAL|nr:hypothetical protein HU200_025799 [Digitaria exilis]
MQCCNVMMILAARPLPLVAAAGEDGGWQLRRDAGALILPALDKTSAQPGQPNGCANQGPHPKEGSCPPPAPKK